MHLKPTNLIEVFLNASFRTLLLQDFMIPELEIKNGAEYTNNYSESLRQ